MFKFNVISILCVGFQVFGDEANLYNIEDVQSQDLGQFSEVAITKDDTLLMKVASLELNMALFEFIELVLY